MKEFELQDLRIRLGEPHVVTEGVGHFWFPGLLRQFPNGDLLFHQR